MWDIESGKELPSLKGHAYQPYSSRFSPDGKTLASGSADKLVKLWQISDGKEVQTFSQADSMRDIAFSADGKKLAVSSFEMTKIWDVSSGKELLSLPSKNGWIVEVAFSPDGKSLVGVSENKDFFIWDINSEKGYNPS